MKKLLLISTIFLVTCGFNLGSVNAETESEVNNKPKIELSEDQKKEMQALHEDMLEQKKEIIKKYIEFGVLTEEKGTKIIEKMESRFKELEANGYVPNWDKHHHRHNHKE
ncbi:DUF2680 domain-containing protein [Bacillus pinisoli]|uniref:DUF2680 domain-containing protein n=1 Tax=Bacillus pinisoli TaxID=2901866 RepID=UPI001FF51AEC